MPASKKATAAATLRHRSLTSACTRGASAAAAGVAAAAGAAARSLTQKFSGISGPFQMFQTFSVVFGRSDVFEDYREFMDVF